MPVDNAAETAATVDTSPPDEATAAPDDVISTVVNGRYKVTSLIGRGGMASVYRAQDLELPREVALKLMQFGSASLEELLRQRTEIATLASLNHPGLVMLFDAGTETLPAGERTFLVMELVDGPNLRQLLAQSLAPDQVAHIASDIAEALHYMHGLGIVHRDVKPANILLAPSALPERSFRAKLADLGIARLIDSGHLTSTGVIVGSANYLSPEQASGGPVGPESDVYSLGLVLLEALTGRKAFPGTGMETISARLAAQPIIPDSVGSGWAALITAMTALDADRRPLPLDVARAAQQLAGVHPTADLTSLVAAEGPEETAVLPAVTAPPPPAVPRRLGRTARRRTTVVAAAGIITVAAVAGVVSWTTAAAPQPGPTVSYPAVSGSLGVHLKELQRNVIP